MTRDRRQSFHDIRSQHNGDEELEQLQRYEDFTTIDWIQDSIIERNRRLRAARKLHTPYHGPRGNVSLAWIWSRLQEVAHAGQSWFIDYKTRPRFRRSSKDLDLSNVVYAYVVGIAIGVNAAVISIVTEWLSDIKMGYCSDGWWLNQQFCCWEIDDEGDTCEAWHAWSTAVPARWAIYVLFAAAFSFVAAHLVRSLAKYAAGSGISEIKCIIGGFIMKGFLGFWTFVVKSITLPLVIASGLSVGKEGPSVHVACCVGNLIASMFKGFSRSQVKMREILTASSAAGVAVAFGSPIGGVLFSIEEMSSVFSIKTMWRSFFCALVATVTLSAMNPYRSGKLVLFQVTYDRDWHFFEIFFFIILGIFGGLYGAFVVKFNLQVAAFRKQYLKNHAIAEAVTLATITAMIGWFNHFMRIDMTESMEILFRECDGASDYDHICQTAYQWPMVNSLFLATVLRMGLVVISYGCKVPAGIFVPSMAIGATFGRMVGIIVKAISRAYLGLGIFAVCQPDVPCITPGTYALLGAAAALSGVMRLTVTVVVIMFELTGALTYILPTMIVLLVTKAVGDFLGTTGIAEEMIRFNGFPFLEKDDHAYNVSVSRVMRQDLKTLPVSGLSVKEIEDILASTDVKGFPVTSADGKNILMGFIERSQLRYVLEKTRHFQDVRPDTAVSFAPDPEDLEDADFAGAAAGPAVGLDEEISMDIMENTTMQDVLKLWPWVNQTPLTVSPQLPLEIAMQLFKRMGPRVILVEDHGALVGLITVKDVLRFTMLEQHHVEYSPWSGEDFDGLVDEARTLTSNFADNVLSWGRRVLRRS